MPVLRSNLFSALNKGNTRYNTFARQLNQVQNSSSPPCGCLFSVTANATASASKVSEASMRLLAAQQEHAAFIRRYRIKPLNELDLDEMLSGELRDKKVRVREPVEEGKFYSMPFGYVALENGQVKPQETIYTDVLKGVGKVKVYFPLEETPVCSGVHVPSFMKPEILRGFKAAGIDIMIFETGGQPDTLCSWMRRLLAERGLSQLMPDSLPEKDLDARVKLNDDMPIIVGVANPGLEDINANGLLLWAGHRLGFVSHRAFAIYDANDKLLHVEKAANPSLAMCSTVMADKVLDKVRELQPKTTLTARL